VVVVGEVVRLRAELGAAGSDARIAADAALLGAS
jgi:hypothetical protein